MTSARRSWTCDVCGKPIRSKTGYVTIGDPVTGGYPRPIPKAEPEPEPDDELVTYGQTVCRTIAEMLSNPRALSNVRFAVMHADCDPNPDSNAYWFAVERARTQTEWAAWASHLGHKDWMGKRELLAFLAMWFDNRGIRNWERLP